MAYSTNMSVEPKTLKGPMSVESKGQMSYQSSVPKPMYTPAPAPKAATTPIYNPPKANPTPLVSAVTRPPAPAPGPNDYNSPANVSAREQLAREAENMQQYGNPQGIQPQYTTQQMGQLAQQSSSFNQSYVPPSPIPAPAPTYTQPAPASSGTPSQASTGSPQMESPTVQALRSQDGGYQNLSQAQAHTLFGTDFTGINQNPDGTFSITAENLKSRGIGTPMVATSEKGASLSRPNVWSAQDEGMLQGHQQELSSIEQQNARPGENPAIIAQSQSRIEYLRDQVNKMNQRKSALALTGNQDTSGMSDQEYLESVLVNPNSGQNAMDAARQVLGINSDNYRRQAQQAAESAAQAAMNTNRQNFNADRDKLLAQLALRGLSPDSDSFAQAQLNKLESDYRALDQAEQAKIQVAMLEVDDKTRAYLERLADKRMEEAHKAIADAVSIANAQANAYSKTVNADVNVNKLGIAEEKNRIDEMYKMGRLTTEQYKAEIAKLNQESLTDLRSSQADLADANAEYTSGAKTDNTVADTGLKEANTNKILTLLPAQLAQLQAQTAKLKRVASGTGGKAGAAATATPDELAAVVQLNKGNMPTSEKALATLLNAVRTVNGDVTELVDVGNEAAKERKQATTISSGFQPLF